MGAEEGFPLKLVPVASCSCRKIQRLCSLRNKLIAERAVEGETVLLCSESYHVAVTIPFTSSSLMNTCALSSPLPGWASFLCFASGCVGDEMPGEIRNMKPTHGVQRQSSSSCIIERQWSFSGMGIGE